MHHQKKTQIHFVGIGGIGMSGIAEVFLNQGYRITGSDLSTSENVRHLMSLGVEVSIGHHPRNVGDADVVVISSAIHAGNPEVKEAKSKRIPVIPRAEMLGELMRGKVGIAVAGSHGKTTATSMLATILTHAKLDPTVVIGGKVNALGCHAKLGKGDFVVAEADESDGSFLHLPATYGMVTNVDNDHLDHFGNLEGIDRAFLDFIGKLPFYGIAAVCGDDLGVQRILSRCTKPVVSYGFSKDCDYFADEVELLALGSRFKVYRREGAEGKGQLLGKVELRVPGKHNIQNSLGAIVIADHLEIPFEKIVGGLQDFTGVKRRFEILWHDAVHSRAVLDDYGHHPTEISATLSTARNFWKGRIISIFQPHRYSRTLHCLPAFPGSFRESDEIYITDVYAAGEKPIDGVSGASLAEAVKKEAQKNQNVSYIGELSEIWSLLKTELKPGDLVICFGAGSITRLASELVQNWSGLEVESLESSHERLC
jgi:UDP-N-acetylmuramate--alanine ligase